jgi:hypothetical protein
LRRPHLPPQCAPPNPCGDSMTPQHVSSRVLTLVVLLSRRRSAAAAGPAGVDSSVSWPAERLRAAQATVTDQTPLHATAHGHREPRSTCCPACLPPRPSTRLQRPPTLCWRTSGRAAARSRAGGRTALWACSNRAFVTRETHCELVGCVFVLVESSCVGRCAGSLRVICASDLPLQSSKCDLCVDSTQRRSKPNHAEHGGAVLQKHAPP